MEQIQPWFYEAFQCVAQACSDTCCAGWEIYVDPAALERYQADDSAFGLYRQSKLSMGQDGPMFALDGQGRCPFLTEEHLCTMILQDGEGSLCHICTHHPRFYKVYGPYDERGIGLCCPEGSRLLLSQPLRFQRCHQPGSVAPDPMAETVFELRGLLQEILLDRSLPYSERSQEALAVAGGAQCQLYGGQVVEHWGAKAQLWQWLLEEMMALEPIHQDWQEYLQRLQAQLPALLEAEPAFCQSDAYNQDQYGDVAAYLLYRHFPDVLEDGALVPRVAFALLSTLFVHLCYLNAWLEQGTLSPEDKVYHLKNWSKQVEYSQENTAQFLAACRALTLQ